MGQKSVLVNYYKMSGKYYTSEAFCIPNGLNGYQALFEEIPKHLRLNDEMIAVVQDSNDNREPYIVTHLYHPKGV